MELFQKAVTVQISHKDKYLTAENNGESVCLDRRSSLSSHWTVEFVSGQNFVRFQSFYGKYLAASDAQFLPGSSSRKVIQTLPDEPDSSTMWEPIRDGFSARFKNPSGYFLRPYGGLPPWRNSVTHDIAHRTATYEKVLWDIHVVQTVPKSSCPSLNLKRNKSNVLFPPNARPPPTLQNLKTGNERARKDKSQNETKPLSLIGVRISRMSCTSTE